MIALGSASALTWAISFRLLASDELDNTDCALLVLVGILTFGGATALLRARARSLVTIVTVSSAAATLWLTHGRHQEHLAIYAVTPAVMSAVSWIVEYYLSPMPLVLGAACIASAVLLVVNSTFWVRGTSVAAFLVSLGMLARRRRDLSRARREPPNASGH